MPNIPIWFLLLLAVLVILGILWFLGIRFTVTTGN